HHPRTPPRIACREHLLGERSGRFQDHAWRTFLGAVREADHTPQFVPLAPGTRTIVPCLAQVERRRVRVCFAHTSLLTLPGLIRCSTTDFMTSPGATGARVSYFISSTRQPACSSSAVSGPM